MTATTLANYIERQQWELVALCLLLGLARTLDAMAPDALPDLLDLLLGESDESR